MNASPGVWLKRFWYALSVPFLAHFAGWFATEHSHYLELHAAGIEDRSKQIPALVGFCLTLAVTIAIPPFVARIASQLHSIRARIAAGIPLAWCPTVALYGYVFRPEWTEQTDTVVAAVAGPPVLALFLFGLLTWIQSAG